MKKLSLFLIATLFSFIAIAQHDGLPHELTREEINLAVERGYERPVDRGISTPPPYSNLRTMAEWEEIEALSIAWISYPATLKQIAAAAVNECQVIIVTENISNTQSYLTSNNAGGPPMDISNVTFINAPINSVWMRDYGQHTVYAEDVGQRFLVDWIYNRPRYDDDVVPDEIASQMGIDLYSTTTAPYDLMNTGGNFMSDGFGTAFASELVLDENSGGNTYWTTFPSHTEAEIDNIMNLFMGIDEYIKMPTLPYDGIHHIDMHMKLLDEETLLVSEYPEGVADGPQIEANLNYVLNNFTTKWGTTFNVIRVPAPPQSGGNYPDNGGWYLTYTNSVFINETILVPTYYSPYDEEALQIYQDALPGYNVVGIDCDGPGESIIAASGAIHCITKAVGVDSPLLISYPCLPNTNDDQNPYNLTAYINHNSGIASATLYWTTDLQSGYSSLSMNYLGNEEWSANIPAQNLGSTVYYYVEATAMSGKTQVRPITAPEGYKSFRVVNEVFGCTEPTACNFDPAATFDDNSCILPDGCTDPLACNYNPSAVCDDGSCLTGQAYTLNFTTDCWGEELSWNIRDDQNNIVMQVGENSYPDQSSFDESVCLAPGCYTFNIFDAYGDGMFGSQWGSCNVDGYYAFRDPEGNLVFEMADPDYGTGTSHSFCVEAPANCPGDFNLDTHRNVSDLLLFLMDIGCSGPDCLCDMNGSGATDSGDLVAFLTYFGEDCP